MQQKTINMSNNKEMRLYRTQNRKYFVAFYETNRHAVLYVENIVEWDFYFILVTTRLFLSKCIVNRS